MIPDFFISLFFFKLKLFSSNYSAGDSVVRFLEMISSWKHAGLNSVSERSHLEPFRKITAV